MGKKWWLSPEEQVALGDVLMDTVAPFPLIEDMLSRVATPFVFTGVVMTIVTKRLGQPNNKLTFSPEQPKPVQQNTAPIWKPEEAPVKYEPVHTQTQPTPGANGLPTGVVLSGVAGEAPLFSVADN
jgi:hypothetical protein